MRYQRFTPGDALAAYVEHFWLVDADLGDRWHEEILVPNGRPTIIVSLADPGIRKNPETFAETPNVSGLSGIGTGPVIIGQRGSVKLVAAQLSPFGPTAFGLAPHIDEHVPLAAWPDTKVTQELDTDLVRLGASEGAVRALEKWLSARFQPLPQKAVSDLSRVYACLDSDLPANISSWADTAGLTHSQLYRLFRNHVGISPKSALMIARYQALVGGLLGQMRGNGLAQLALLQGYYDQAHANRDFRRFTGVTPQHFTQTLNGIARMMHQPMSDLSKNLEARGD
ncbi:AraC family transcriptional regulator [Devosia sediminis]|uniref:AraC family transcriptional regulator n=1 Tax=Devosia sediminis TaxID=2798801 RepID=A0A934MQ21_9HYPH|nr:helix-turn-helix domain-containing protein [Devosia sediminis]MBJ3783919.1 AraC family transcriptional regulator [Devosia sediminis]